MSKWIEEDRVHFGEDETVPRYKVLAEIRGEQTPQRYGNITDGRS